MKQTDRIDRCGGIGTKTMQQFQALGVETAGDLLRYYPVRYEFFGNPIPLEEAGAGNVVTIRVIPEGRPQNMRNSRMQMISVWAGDGTGRIRLNWYHMPYVIYRIKKGQTYFFRGTLIRDSFGLSMNQPDIWEPEEYRLFAGRLQASYALVKGLSRNRVQKALTQILDEAEDLSDELPAGIRKAYDLPDWTWAVRQIHFPESTEALAAARRRLVFDEFFLFILGIRQMKNHQEFHENPFHFEQHAYADRLLAGLPYRLTGDQQRTLEEIRRDLRGDHLMNRLVQGDVGSGKTILAMLALTEAAENGWQGALMAPTEVLARQHAQSFREMYERREIPFRVELLTGSMTAAEKRKAYQRIADHKADIIIGTHALIQEKVVYDRLALVVTDEQHRFGVRQRKAFSQKGEMPHTLVMSATPIPRTLAIILYGDLDISVIHELPGERLPIKNCVVDSSYREKAYTFMQKEIREGRQVYVICPLAEESEGIPAENVVDYADKLRKIFPPSIRIEYLHGRMDAKTKNARMEAFLSGEIQILVSTTVIEVGVNVPNATVMMIENAERFGVAQLHQLRGRVGRGGYQSYCIFMTDSGQTERLEILKTSNDGFQIAEEDLKLRGPGDLFGTRQSGSLQFSLGDIFTDHTVLQKAAEAAGRVLSEDLELQQPEHTVLREQIERGREREIARIL